MNTMTAPAPAPSAPAENTRHALIDVVLSDVENVARDTNVYTFRRPDGGKLPPYKAGAHIDIHLPNGLIRQFSLLNPSADPNAYVVAIKLDGASRGGSRYIFDELKVGDALQIGAPRNNFPLVGTPFFVPLAPRHGVSVHHREARRRTRTSAFRRRGQRGIPRSRRRHRQ